jgi:hypothetical protein
MNKKKLIIVLSLVVIIWALFLFLTRKKDLPEDPIIEEEIELETGELPLESKEVSLSVGQLYERIPKPIESHIPEGSDYYVEYHSDLVAFSVIIDAENWEDLVAKGRESLFFFYQFDADPCKKPLLDGIFWSATDMSKIDMSGKNILEEICGLD